MHLTKQTDFSFRALIYLMQRDEGELVQIKQICAFYDISQNHMSKVILGLVNAGYVISTRGKGGGIKLAVPVSEINLGQVVRDCEPSLDVVDCKEPECRITAHCELKVFLNAATEAFINVLSQYTLADLSSKALYKEVQESVLTIIDARA